MSIPDSVIFCECWARDGLQSIPKLIPTADKIEMINRIIDSGIRKLEVTSFSHPQLLPQFADCVEVLQGIKRQPDVSYVVLMPNEKGFNRFETCVKEGYGADEIILMISASVAHNTVNFRMDHDTAKRSHAAIMQRSHRLGVRVIGCTGTVYGCPIAGDVPMHDVIDITRFYIDAGAQTIMLGDTIGSANPRQVRERLGELMTLFPQTEFIAHFHDTRGTGVVNSLVALECGVRYVDGSLGAIGGQPHTGKGKYQYGFTGNTCTEDLLCMLEEMGVDSGVDLSKLLENGRRADEVSGQRLRANIIRSGLVNHEPKKAAFMDISQGRSVPEDSAQQSA